MNNKIHVVPCNGEWSVRKDNAQRSSGIFKTQAEAKSRAREIAMNQGLELEVHGRNGRIRESSSYGKDPCPPRDK